jgi:hypothetical protein
MKSWRFSHWLWVVLVLGASGTLYYTSYQVQDQQERLQKIKAEQAVERENIHVLEAEWAFLTAPERLQMLSDKYLVLKPVTVAQIVPEHRLDRLLARRDTATQLAASTSKQQLALALERGLDAR